MKMSIFYKIVINAQNYTLMHFLNFNYNNLGNDCPKPYSVDA